MSELLLAGGVAAVLASIRYIQKDMLVMDRRRIFDKWCSYTEFEKGERENGTHPHTPHEDAGLVLTRPVSVALPPVWWQCSCS